MTGSGNNAWSDWRLRACAALTMLVAVPQPVSALGCRQWTFINSTFVVDQSNGYTMMVTFGPSAYSNAGVRFGTNGTVSHQKKGTTNNNAFGFFRPGGYFSSTSGFIQFEVQWNIDPEEAYTTSTKGIYSGNPRNIRTLFNNSLIADLAGNTWGYTTNRRNFVGGEIPDDLATAKWSTPDRITCRPEHVIRGPGDPPPYAVSAPPPPEPSMPIQTGPKPGARVVSQRGRAPTPTGTSFVGSWDTVTEQGARYEIVLSGGDSEIGGRFTLIGGNQIYSGTIQGKLESNGTGFRYTYRQNNGATGKGIFALSADGRTIDGVGTADNPPLMFTWKGTRK